MIGSREQRDRNRFALAEDLASLDEVDATVALAKPRSRASEHDVFVAASDGGDAEAAAVG